jgi:hypothetical protein
MKKRIWLLGLVTMALLVTATPTMAQGPIIPQHSDPTWQASYWNNTGLSGTAALTRADTNIDFDWGSGSPASQIVADNFSARWTRYVDVTPGTYVFTVTSDDGIRLWVDGTLILDKWYAHASETHTAEVYLGTGHHLLQVEYFEQTGLAVAKVQWALKGQVPPTGNWKAEYFNNLTLSGTPALVRNEAAVNYAWGSGSPQAGTINADNFSARWTQTMTIAAGTYTFKLTVDDGARVWVNGHLLIDVWYEQAATTYTGQMYLPAGPVTVEVQYFEKTGLATVQLSWTSGSTPAPAPAGTVIVDDVDPGFVTGGVAAGWRTVAEGYNGHLTWTYNNRTAQYNYNWARWYPSLQAAWYEVFVYVPDRYTTTARARYWVRHAGGYTLKIVDQSANGAKWVSLGTYKFAGNSNDYVSLADVTYETYRTRLIGFDAVKWEPR